MNYPKIKVKIVFDIDKINTEKKWSLKSMIDMVDETARDAGMIKVDELLYETAGNSEDLQCISRFTFDSLAECEWFTSNIKEWVSIHPYEGVSDIVALCKKYELGNFEKDKQKTHAVCEKRKETINYPKIQVKIVFDIDKINAENKWSLKSMIDMVDETSQNAGMIKVDELLYETAGNNQDLQCISKFTFRSLAKCEWFTSNIKEWSIVHPYEGVSDVVALCKKYELGNYKNA